MRTVSKSGLADLNRYTYAYENTGRDMIVEEALVTDFQSEQKDLIPKALHPDDFVNLQKEY